jgi:hypothetical protein
MLVRAIKPTAYAGRMVQVGEEIDIAPEHAGVSCDAFLGWAVPVNRTNATRRDLENRLRAAAIAINDLETAMHAARECGDAIGYQRAEEAWIRARHEHTEATAALTRLNEAH